MFYCIDQRRTPSFHQLLFSSVDIKPFYACKSVFAVNSELKYYHAVFRTVHTFNITNLVKINSLV